MTVHFLQAAIVGSLLLFPFIAFALFVGILFFTAVINGFLTGSTIAADVNGAIPKQPRPGKRTAIFLLSFAIATGIVVILSLFGMMLLSGLIPGID